MGGVFRYDQRARVWTRVPTGSARRAGGPTVTIPHFEVRTFDIE